MSFTTLPFSQSEERQAGRQAPSRVRRTRRIRRMRGTHAGGQGREGIVCLLTCLLFFSFFFCGSSLTQPNPTLPYSLYCLYSLSLCVQCPLLEEIVVVGAPPPTFLPSYLPTCLPICRCGEDAAELGATHPPMHIFIDPFILREAPLPWRCDDAPLIHSCALWNHGSPIHTAFSLFILLLFCSIMLLT